MLALWNENKLVIVFLILSIIVWLFYIYDFVAELMRWVKIYQTRKSVPARNNALQIGCTLLVFILASAFVFWCVFWPHPY